MPLTVVIPTFRSGPQLARTLDFLSADKEHLEVIVVDAGDAEDSKTFQSVFPWVRWMVAAPGRGIQLRAGVEVASNQALVFLHSDTVLEAGWMAAIERATGEDAFVLGCFRLHLEHSGLRFRFIERVVALRCLVFQLPYGDQCLFTTRARYDEMGGFPAIPLMEDVELVWKAQQLGRLTRLNLRATTSAEKWLRDGVIKRTWKNWRTYWAYKRSRSDAWELAKHYDS